MSGELPPVEGPWHETEPGDPQPARQRALVEEVDSITAATRQYLPNSFQVHGEVTAGRSGPLVSLEVKPPIGPPVSAGLTPELVDEEHVAFSPDEREELARKLAASAAVQLRTLLGSSVNPPAR